MMKKDIEDIKNELKTMSANVTSIDERLAHEFSSTITRDSWTQADGHIDDSIVIDPRIKHVLTNKERKRLRQMQLRLADEFVGASMSSGKLEIYVKVVTDSPTPADLPNQQAETNNDRFQARIAEAVTELMTYIHPNGGS